MNEPHSKTPIEANTQELERPQPLFFADSDDEGVGMAVSSGDSVQAPLHHVGQPLGESESDLGYVDIPQPSSPSHASSSASSDVSSPSPGRLSRSPSIEAVEPPRKKARMASEEVTIVSDHGGVPSTSTLTPQLSFVTTYLGSFVVGNAWSTVKGKGYCKPGDEIIIYRDNPDNAPSTNGKSQAKGKGAKTGANSRGGAKKQLTLSTLIKQPPKLKKKVDTSVRIMNKRGFGS